MIIQQNSPLSRPTRVVVIGAGLVGSTFAFALLRSGLAGEIVLLDVDQARAEGEAMDLSHALPFSPSPRVWAGDYEDCALADIVVITAGANQKPEETRLDLAQRNADVFSEIMPRIMASGFDGVFVVATNPVDVLTHIATQLSGLPAGRVIGSGAILDTARLRVEIGRHCGVDSHSVHAYVIGEHGDSSVPVWSSATIGGMPLEDYCSVVGIGIDGDIRADLFGRVRNAAHDIIGRKGATYYGVAAGLQCIVEAILRDQHTVLCASSPVSGIAGIADVSLSLPCVVNRRGIKRTLPLKLAHDENEGLHRSAGVLQKSIASLRLPTPPLVTGNVTRERAA